MARVQQTAQFFAALTDVNQVGVFGNTPLSVVTTWGDVEAARLLLEAGAEIDAKLEFGDTALHRAVLFGNVELVKLFLESGASIDERNDEGRTARDLAKGSDEISNLLSLHHRY